MVGDVGIPQRMEFWVDAFGWVQFGEVHVGMYGIGKFTLAYNGYLLEIK